MESAESSHIVICLGSSCFARGNCDHLATIKEYLEKRSLAASVRLSGLLCQDQCTVGPNMTIGTEQHHEVTSDRLAELLKRLGIPGKK
jgi:NADH:ubiquinone oxidoreductase subunit E